MMLDKQFSPHAVESQAQARWQDSLFAPSGQGQAFCVMLPPPNVTGTLHMGHGFQHTLMDVLTRYHRMCGDNTLWQPGTDHAGIATQMVVERQLERQGLTRQHIGRSAFLDKVWAWKAESGGTISSQMRVLGDTVDWSRERFTMDEGLSKAVIEAFVRLYRDDLIYRGKRLVNWDPILLTAVSDLEVLSSEEQGSLWHIRYPLVIPTAECTHITIATTRPETLLGDVAVAIHPLDERYRALIGQSLRLPLTERDIPIIADDYVDPAFGSGCVKITPAHDFNDYAIGQRHDLPLINIFTTTAALNDQVPEAYRGLSREEARTQVLRDLEAGGFLVKTEAHTLKIPRSERSNAIVEPFLTEQWYVKTATLAEPALAAVEEGRIEFVPDNWRNTYRQWLDNIQDWCISRQLWWGHRIPAWYDSQGNIYVGTSEEQVRVEYGLSQDIQLRQDEDVLDTWFSSALWPFSTLGWPNASVDLATFYPTSLLVTGFDIIFFWVARMVMFGLYFLKEVPFKKVLFTGLIRDHDGQKMSKSKGNVLDPLDLIRGITLPQLIEKRTANLMMASQIQSIDSQTRKQFPDGIPAFGTDALRFTFCALATHGRDIRFDLNRVEGYRNFCNKLWNATRFVQMQLEQHGISDLSKPWAFDELDVCEKWILQRLNDTIFASHKAIQDLRFDLLAHTLYEFVWNEFCDWYVELAKINLNASEDNVQKIRILSVAVTVLETMYRLLHPIMPFITEELWQSMAPLLALKEVTLLLRVFPQANEAWQESEALTQVTDLKAWAGAIRQIRSDYTLPPSKRLPLVYIKGAGQASGFSLQRELMHLVKSDACQFVAFDFEPTGQCASHIVEGVEILLPLTDLFDANAAQERLEKMKKEWTKTQQEIDKVQAKLANAAYVDKAPATVVAAERERLALLQLTAQQLHSKIIA